MYNRNLMESNWTQLILTCMCEINCKSTTCLGEQFSSRFYIENGWMLFLVCGACGWSCNRLIKETYTLLVTKATVKRLWSDCEATVKRLCLMIWMVETDRLVSRTRRQNHRRQQLKRSWFAEPAGVTTFLYKVCKVVWKSVKIARTFDLFNTVSK